MSPSRHRHHSRLHFAPWPLAVALVITTLWPAVAPAQFRRGAADGEGAGFFSVGGARLDSSELDDQLAAAGYPVFGREAITVGGGGYGVHGTGILVGGEGYGVLTGEEAHQGRSVSLAGGFGLFNVGYMMPRTGRLRVYPLLGFGGGGTSLRIGSEPAASSFGNVLADPNRHATLSRASLLVSVGGGVEFRGSRSGSGVLVGVRAGYLFAPLSSSWRLDGNVVGSAPDTSLAGPFVRVIVGGG